MTTLSFENVSHRRALVSADGFILHLAAIFSIVASLVHLWMAPAHLAEWWGYGAFFLAAAAAQGLFGLALLRWPARWLLLAGIVGNLALVSFYAVTRTVGIPFFGPHAGMVEEVGVPDLVATGAELGLVVALVMLSGTFNHAKTYLTLGILQAFGVGLTLHLLQGPAHGGHELNSVLAWLQGSAPAVPLSVLAVWLSTPLARRLLSHFGNKGARGTECFYSRYAWALIAASAYALASAPANGLAGQHAVAGSFLAEAGRDAGVTLGAALLVLLAVAMLRGTPWEEPRALRLWHPRAITALAGAAVGFAVLAGPTVFGYALSSEAEAQAAPACSAASYDRSYDVAAVNVRIPFNRWGNVDPHGQMYVLQGDKAAVKNWSTPLAEDPSQDPAGNRRLRPRPLVIRANVGECVKIEFTNELAEVGGDGLPNDPRASMKAFGPSYDAQTSDGGAVGYNEDTTVPNEDDPATPKQDNKITYYWKAPEQEGSYVFRDQGAPAGSEANSGSVAHGLYGVLAVEPQGSTYRDPVSGKELYTETGDVSGDLYVDADIIPAGGKAFRETMQISQDELPGGFGFGFNYGAEPDKNRVGTNPAGAGGAEQAAPDAIGEETSLSSWVYGDPALIKLASGEGPWLSNAQRTNDEDCGLGKPGFNSDSCYVSNVVRSYIGDPSKVRFVHAGVKETHVFHMHAHQWKAEPNDDDSTAIDSQTYGPGETFTADLIGGSGSKPGTFGDSIFHCHLYPHFADGFWSLFRTHDVLEDGKNKNPDGINVRPLKQLPDRAGVNLDTGKPYAPQATPDNPGYPRFIPGKVGWRAPQPPGSISETVPSGQADDPATPTREDFAKDDPATIEREDLKPATRAVAGIALDPDAPAPQDPQKAAARTELLEKLRTEGKVQNLNYTGNPDAPANALPGAPFKNPCPSGSRQVTYNVSIIQTDVVYNEAGEHDTQGRVVVLDKDADDILAGRKKPEPLFIRVNAGDCINYNLTNRLPNWVGNDAFVKLSQANMVGGHIHLVKFDVLASDGASNGWNYQQAAFTKEMSDFNKEVLAGDKPCDSNGCRLPLPADYDPSTSSQGMAPGQTISERWYADTELKTAFAHDHHFPALDQGRGYFNALVVEKAGMDFRNPKTGEFYQPGNGSTPGAPTCGNACNADAAGTAMDIIGPGPNDDFREFGLAVQDFVTLTKKGGNPKLRSDTVNPPPDPEAFSDADPGVMAINYRNAPLRLRQEKNGQKVDPAHAFSSSVFGDPMTPILEAYAEDPVQVRLIQGSQEEQHVFSMNGMRWRQQPDDPESSLVSSQALGISEAFNLKVPKMECGANDATCAGDYLYSTTSTDDLYLGVWGLLRARGKQVPSLLPLPDNATPAQPTDTTAPTTTVPADEGAPTSTGTGSLAPPDANSPGTPCEPGAPTRKFNIVAMEAKVEYNKQGDHDPYGLIYALAEDEAAIRAGTKKPEPLVLRANEGDCIETRLFNKLTPAFLSKHGNAGTDGDPTLPTEPATGTPAGLRVSLHPQLVKYDVRGSDGTAAGYNRDQTVGPGESKLYRWYADDPGTGELGATNLTDFGDVRGHRHHGLFAGLNIEPKGSTYHDPKTGEEIKGGQSADIRVPGAGNDFREFTTFFQDGLNLRDASGAIIEDALDHPPTPEEPQGTPMDAEDQGEKGFNYRNAPFTNRIGDIPETGMDGQKMANVFSSKAHGDPDTPIFRAFAGDKVRMRVLQGSDKPRQNTFQVSGHSWLSHPDDPNSNRIGTQGGISVGSTFNVQLGSAGGPGRAVGDYSYGTSSNGWHLWGGLWGIMRVYPNSGGAVDPTPMRPVDDPRASGNRPILPLEIASSATSVGLAAPATVNYGQAATLSGKLLRGSDPVVGRQVILEHKPTGTAAFSEVKRANTAAGGAYSFAGIVPKKNTEYRVRFAGDPRVGFQASQSPVKKVLVKALVSNTTTTTSVKLGKVRPITGAVTPNVAGSVKVTVKRGTTVIVRNKVVPLRGSRFSFSYKPPSVGTYSVSVAFPGNPDYAANSSPVKRFKVVR